MAGSNPGITNKLVQGYGIWSRIASWADRHPVVSRNIKRTSIVLPPAVTLLIDRIIADWSGCPATMFVGLVALAVSLPTTLYVSSRIGFARSEVKQGEDLAELADTKAQLQTARENEAKLRTNIAANIDPEVHRALEKKTLTQEERISELESRWQLYAGSTHTLELNVGGGKIVKQVYYFVKELGRGGMGTIYLVKNHSTGGQIEVLKVANKNITSEATFARFVREAIVLIENPKLRGHKNLPRVYGFGRLDDGRPFYTMKFIKGISLRDYQDYGIFAGSSQDIAAGSSYSNTKRRVPPDIAVEIMIKIANVIDDVHNAGIAHRDLKPDNIMLHLKRTPIKISRENKKPYMIEMVSVDLVVIDFGLAKGIEEMQDMTWLTQADEVFGTPFYMAPEQYGGVWQVDELDRRVDLYPLGVIFFELLTGELIYPVKEEGEGNKKYLRRLHDEVWIKGKSDNVLVPNVAGSLGMPELANRFSIIFRGLLHPNREERFPSARVAAGEFYNLQEEMRELRGEPTGVGWGSRIFAPDDDE